MIKTSRRCYGRPRRLQWLSRNTASMLLPFFSLFRLCRSTQVLPFLNSIAWLQPCKPAKWHTCQRRLEAGRHLHSPSSLSRYTERLVYLPMYMACIPCVVCSTGRLTHCTYLYTKWHSRMRAQGARRRRNISSSLSIQGQSIHISRREAFFWPPCMHRRRLPYVLKLKQVFVGWGHSEWG